MTNTEKLIRQAAYELQISPIEVKITAATPDIKTMEVINTYTATFKANNGDDATAEIKDGMDYIAIHDALRAAYKRNTPE